MIQVILQGTIATKIEHYQGDDLEDIKDRSLVHFALRCYNQLQNEITVGCVALNKMAERIFNQYRFGDVVTMMGTIYVYKKELTFLIFSIEPAYINEIPYKKMLIDDDYVKNPMEFTIEDIKAFLKLK